MQTSPSFTRALLALLVLSTVAAAALAQEPGTPVPASSEASDQKLGSVLVYNLYSSNSLNLNAESTDIGITNTNATTSVVVHFFFINGGSGAVTDAFAPLAPNQTLSFLVSQPDPDVTGYIVAVAVNSSTGCPISFNYLAGSESVKLASGHAANLNAEAFAALYSGTLPGCSTTAQLAFDGASYNQAARTLALDTFATPLEGNSMLLVINNLNGNLATGVGGIGNLSGLVYDDAENGNSFSFYSGCQFRSVLSDSFPAITPPLSMFVPWLRTGWMKFYGSYSIQALTGAAINFNPNPTTAVPYCCTRPNFNGGHNLHQLTLTPVASLTIPVSPPIFTPDLALTLTDAPDPVIVGRELTYTIVVRNKSIPTAYSTATGVVVTDALPAGVTFVSASATVGNCVRARDTISCNIGALASGASAQVTIVVRATSQGTVDNTASVTSNEPDPRPSNNTATQSTTLKRPA